jgi:hypothetical protein
VRKLTSGRAKTPFGQAEDKRSPTAIDGNDGVMDLARPNGDTSLTIDASEKRKWSTVTCASCGQLFFGRLQLEKPGIPPTAWNLQKERRDDFSDRGGRCQSFSISNRLEIHIHKQAKEPFGSFPCQPIACINAGYARDLAGQWLRHTLGAANCSCAYILGLFYPILEAHIVHTSNKPFHKTRLRSTRSLGRLSPTGETIYSMKGN